MPVTHFGTSVQRVQVASPIRTWHGLNCIWDDILGGVCVILSLSSNGASMLPQSMGVIVPGWCVKHRINEPDFRGFVCDGIPLSEHSQLSHLYFFSYSFLFLVFALGDGHLTCKKHPATSHVSMRQTPTHGSLVLRFGLWIPPPGFESGTFLLVPLGKVLQWDIATGLHWDKWAYWCWPAWNVVTAQIGPRLYEFPC